MNMNIKIAKFTHIALLFALVLLVLPGMSSAAPVDVFLRVETTTVTMPDATVVPVWAFAQCTDVTYTTCGAATIPGPRITAVEGDDLTINVQNTLVNVPISIVIPGQTTTMTPVWIDIADPYGTPTGTGSRPADVTSRVRSFTHETAAGGGTNSYTWTGVKAGTYMYQSGTHPALQVQMGLYGALTVDTTGGEAYAGVPYDTEVVLFYSELDPVFHGGVSDTGPVYPSTNVYKPRYFLVNGMPYAAGDAPIPGGNVGQNVLIRFLNAGLDTHMPMMKGSDVTIVAEDGFPGPYARPSYSIQLHAGKTVDAIFSPAKYGTYPVLDRRLFLVNSMQSPGGMLANINVGSGNATGVGVVRGYTWYLDTSKNTVWDPGSDAVFEFGVTGDVPVTGDWGGTGTSKAGVFRNGEWYFDVNGNGSWDPGLDFASVFGTVGDNPVTGDWSGAGRTGIGVFRGSTWYLDTNYNGVFESGVDLTFDFGIPGDNPVTGDWDGNGRTEVGIVRGYTWYLDSNGNGAWDPGTDAVFEFGIAGDIPITGDWDGDGRTEIGVVRGFTWYLDMNGNRVWDPGVDAVFEFGVPGDIPITGRW